MAEILATITEYYTKIHDIPVLYCAILAVAIPFIIIAVGYLIGLFGEALATIVGMALAPQVAMAMVNYLFMPGVVIHEMAHAFMALITGARITEIALFKKQDDSLGHVNFRNRGNALAVMIQNILVSSAPMYIGALVVYGAFYWMINIPGGTWYLIVAKVLLGYLGVSMFFHMTMSGADIKIYMKGVPLLIPILFIIAIPLRLTGVI